MEKNISEKDKKIAILSLDNTFTFGGAIISLYHMFKGINKAVITPIVVSGQPLEYLEEKFPDCKCYHYIPKLLWVNNKKYLKLRGMWPFRCSRLLLKCLNIVRFGYWMLFIIVPESLKLYRIGRKHRISLIHLNNGYLHLPWILAAKMLRVPCVAHLRGFVQVNGFARFIARFVDHHVAISEAIRGNLLEADIPIERISLVHDAIDLDEFNIDIDCGPLVQEFGLVAGQPTYGLFGRVIPWKGIREFILAAQKVNDEIPEARGFIVGGVSDGDNAFFEEMQSLIVELGLDGKVILTGYRTDVPDMISLMDVVVHASTSPEPFGMVIIEGMAMGKPIVATRAGGPLDIVEEGQTGYLVELGNVQELGRAITTLLQDQVLCRTMGEKGRARVEKLFSNQLYGQKMEQLFLRLTSGGKDIYS